MANSALVGERRGQYRSSWNMVILPNMVTSFYHKKLSYRRVTARCVLSVVILPIAMKQCRNYLYDES